MVYIYAIVCPSQAFVRVLWAKYVIGRSKSAILKDARLSTKNFFTGKSQSLSVQHFNTRRTSWVSFTPLCMNFICEPRTAPRDLKMFIFCAIYGVLMANARQTFYDAV